LSYHLGHKTALIILGELMAITLPIPTRDLRVNPLSTSEMLAMLNAYAASAIDPVTIAFATGLSKYLSARSTLIRDIAREVSYPEITNPVHLSASPM
jgi:hypothetical protein